jgi:hypothetical protein
VRNLNNIFFTLLPSQDKIHFSNSTITLLNLTKTNNYSHYFGRNNDQLVVVVIIVGTQRWDYRESHTNTAKNSFVIFVIFQSQFF